MNIKAVIAALKSPKTPAPLKRGLMKKYAKQLHGQVKNMGALSSTIVGEVYSGNPHIKMKDDDFKNLKIAIVNVLQKFPNAYKEYKEKGLSDTRFYWDILHFSKFDIRSFYEYLHDAHIETALKIIIDPIVKNKLHSNPAKKTSLDKQSRRVDKAIELDLKRAKDAKLAKSKFSEGDIITLKDNQVEPRFRPYRRKYMIINTGKYGYKVQDIDDGTKANIAIKDLKLFKVIDKG